MAQIELSDDTRTIADIHRAAFGQEDEAELVMNLMTDPTASPRLSLLARHGGRPAGHVLFTRVTLDSAVATILCPLGVLPGVQRQGVGSALVQAGLGRLRKQGTQLVFVLGDPAYYGRFGFSATALLPPYPMPEAYAGAWQALILNPAPSLSSRVSCAAALMRESYWS